MSTSYTPTFCMQMLFSWMKSVLWNVNSWLILSTNIVRKETNLLYWMPVARLSKGTHCWGRVESANNSSLNFKQALGHCFVYLQAW